MIALRWRTNYVTEYKINCKFCKQTFLAPFFVCFSITRAMVHCWMSVMRSRTLNDENNFSAMQPCWYVSMALVSVACTIFSDNIFALQLLPAPFTKCRTTLRSALLTCAGVKRRTCCQVKFAYVKVLRYVQTPFACGQKCTHEICSSKVQLSCHL